MSFAQKLTERISQNLHVIKEMREKRLEVCNKCPELTDLRRCQKCGCFMDAKTALKGASCPLGKW